VIRIIANPENTHAKYTHATCWNQLWCGFLTPGNSIAMRLHTAAAYINVDMKKKWSIRQIEESRRESIREIEENSRSKREFES
jgi:hypothetical protein